MADPVTILNLIFCIIIVALGYWEYHKKRKFNRPLYRYNFRSFRYRSFRDYSGS